MEMSVYNAYEHKNAKVLFNQYYEIPEGVLIGFVVELNQYLW